MSIDGKDVAFITNSQSNSIERPLGIRILAVLNVVVNLIGLSLLFALRDKVDPKLGNDILLIPKSTNLWYSILGVAFLFAGIGMWHGKKWSWWMVATSYLQNSIYKVGSSIFALVMTGSVERVLDAVVSIASALISLAVCSYFFQENVLRFFSIDAENKKRLVWHLIVFALVVIFVRVLFLALPFLYMGLFF